MEKNKISKTKYLLREIIHNSGFKPFFFSRTYLPLENCENSIYDIVIQNVVCVNLKLMNICSTPRELSRIPGSTRSPCQKPRTHKKKTNQHSLSRKVDFFKRPCIEKVIGVIIGYWQPVLPKESFIIMNNSLVLFLDVRGIFL